MTSYKVITVDVPYWGFGTQLERYAAKVGNTPCDWLVLFGACLDSVSLVISFLCTRPFNGRFIPRPTDEQ